jgi:hypothetical protein
MSENSSLMLQNTKWTKYDGVFKPIVRQFLTRWFWQQITPIIWSTDTVHDRYDWSTGEVHKYMYLVPPRHIQWSVFARLFHLRAHGTFTKFSPICFFFNLLDVKSSPVIISKFYTIRILPLDGQDIWLYMERFWVRIPLKPQIFFSIKCSTMYCYNFICNNQEESKCSYSVIYLVKYLYFSCTNKI